MSVASVVATEKSRSAWRNAKARLAALGPQLQSWIEDLEPVGEQEGTLLLVDRSAPPRCRRCEALVGQALLPLGYTGARILPERELAARRGR